MDENLPLTAQPLHEDSFDTAVRGYNRQQVHEYISRSRQVLETHRQHLNAARAETQHARAEAERAQAEIERLRSAPVVVKPVHEEVSGRLSQILKLAAEEADQERATAEREIAKLRSESRAESERLVSEARAEADRQVRQARDTAERELAQARDIAERELRAARAEAERLQSDTQAQADELIEEAQRRAGAVNEVSDQRLATLTATHGEAVLRLGQIRDVLADLLDRDAVAGSLAQVVEAVMAPPGSHRPEIDTRPELEDGLEARPEPYSEEVSEELSDGLAELVQHGRQGQGYAQSDQADVADDDQTSVYPPVSATAVHPPIEAEVIDPAPSPIRQVDHEIDLRDLRTPAAASPGDAAGQNRN